MSLAIPPQGALAESDRARKRRLQDESSGPDLDPLVRTEWSMRPDAVLGVLLLWRSSGSQNRWRGAHNLVVAWLQSSLTFEDFDGSLSDARSPDNLAMCEASSVQGICLHVRSAAPPATRTSGWARAAKCLAELHRLADSCEACAVVLAALIQGLSRVLGERLTETGHQRFKQTSEQDPCQEKRRRTDEDVTSFVLSQSRKESMSAGTFANTQWSGLQPVCGVLVRGFLRPARLRQLVDLRPLQGGQHRSRWQAIGQPSGGVRGIRLLGLWVWQMHLVADTGLRCHMFGGRMGAMQAERL